MFSNSSNRKQLLHLPNIISHQTATSNNDPPADLRLLKIAKGRENLLSPNKTACASSHSAKKTRRGSFHKLFTEARRTTFNQTFLSIIKSPQESRCGEQGSTNRKIIQSQDNTLPTPRKSKILQVTKLIDIKIDPKHTQKEPNSISLSDIIYQFGGQRLSNVDLSCIQENRDDLKQYESMFMVSDSFFREILASD